MPAQETKLKDVGQGDWQVSIPGEIIFQLDTDPATDPPVFTLTCTSTGGPATTVSWRRDGTMLSDDSTYSITSQVTDAVTLSFSFSSSMAAWAHNGDGIGKLFHSVSTLQCNMHVLLILLFLILVQVCSDCCNYLYTCDLSSVE